MIQKFDVLSFLSLNFIDVFNLSAYESLSFGGDSYKSGKYLCFILLFYLNLKKRAFIIILIIIISVRNKNVFLVDKMFLISQHYSPKKILFLNFLHSNDSLIN